VLPVELVWTPKLNGLPGEYRAGYYYSSAKARTSTRTATASLPP
jgi:carbohydrate-selective porin OprB